MIEIKEMPSFKEHPERERIIELMKRAINYFKELDGKTIFLGITTNSWACASADSDNMLLKFKPTIKKVQITTVFHEIMHLVQNNCKGFPKTEESCDLYSLARIPDEMIDEKEGPSYVFGGGKDAVINARKAIKYKEAGNRCYLKYYRELCMKEKPIA